MKIDLHVHTIFSDGEYTPLEILNQCKAEDVNIVSITDHNNLKGSKNAMLKNPYNDITVISGVELAAKYSLCGGQLHILGYNINLNDEKLNSVLDEIMKDSIRRIESLLYQLKVNFNITFKDNDVSEIFTSCGNIGRPEVAKLCVKYGYVTTVDEAFKKFFEPVHHKLVRKKVDLSDKECIEYIRNAGGIACLAHPITLKKNNQELREYISKLLSYGLEAVEVYHSKHTKAFSDSLLNITKEMKLLYSVGSDYHGPLVTPDTMLGRGINNNLNMEGASILSKIFKE